MSQSRGSHFIKQSQLSSYSFRQLTYIQFCMMPNLFQQYISVLVYEQNYKAIGDIFILYSQTLFQLIPLPVGNINLSSFIYASALGQQFVKLLTIAIRNIPLGNQQLIFSKNIPICLYNFLATSILAESQQRNRNNMKIYSNINSQRIYYMMLGDYFCLLSIQEDIKRGKKSISALSEQPIKQQIKSFTKHEKMIGNLKKEGYILAEKLRAFVSKFFNLQQKLMYVLDSSNNIRAQPVSSSVASSIQLKVPLSLSKTHLNTFYLKCISNTQKQQFIKRSYESLIKTKQTQRQQKIAQIQLMCLLYLQQNKLQTVVQKLQIYIILASIKVSRDKNIQGLIEQIKVLLSFQALPKPQYIFLLICTIVSFSQLQTCQISQLINLILKSYMNSPQSNNKSYIKLAILSSLYSKNKRNNNRKIQIQKLCEYNDIVSYIGNLEIIDYLMQLVWNGKQLKLLSGNANKNQIQAQGSLESIFNLRDVQSYTRQYLFKKLIPNQETDIQTPIQKLHILLCSLIQKRIAITNQTKYLKQHLHNCLLSLLFQCTTQPNQNLPNLLPICISILKQYSIISTHHTINEKLSKLLLSILYLSLSAKKCRKQAIICLLLTNNKINYDKIQTIVRIHSEQFTKINRQLFYCILSYDFIQILCQNYRGSYIKLMNQWIEDSQNYLYSWPDTRKDKILQTKRNKFIAYLSNKFGIEKQIL